MKLIRLNKTKRHLIWASRALVGESLLPLDNVLIETNNNQIVKISQMPKDMISVDECVFLEDTTLLPGLIDAHVHLALDGKNFKQAYELWSEEDEILDIMQARINNYLNNGIIAVRDGGDNKALNLRLAKKIQEKQTLPKLISTGQALRKEGHYGSFLGPGILSKKDIPQFISNQAKLGIDQLKVLLSGIVSFKEFGKVGKIQFDLEELRLIVASARYEGLKVMVHASSPLAVALAIEAQVDSIEHGYFLEESSLNLMAEKNIFWLPTIIPVAIHSINPSSDETWSSHELAIISKVYKNQLTKLKLAESIGTPLGVGTDAGASGVLHGTSLLLELLKYSESGLSNQTILQAVTKNNAKILGQEKSLGTIDIKKEPRLIGVLGNPLENLQNLKNINCLLL